MELNAFSLEFADHLFRAFPDWHAFARVESEEGVATGYLIVEVPPESGMRSRFMCGPTTKK